MISIKLYSIHLSQYISMHCARLKTYINKILTPFTLSFVFTHVKLFKDHFLGSRDNKKKSVPIYIPPFTRSFRVQTSVTNYYKRSRTHWTLLHSYVLWHLWGQPLYCFPLHEQINKWIKKLTFQYWCSFVSPKIGLNKWINKNKLSLSFSDFLRIETNNLRKFKV